jgi:uncharacterized SAM-binding protein YcdF (DUF218 family)
MNNKSSDELARILWNYNKLGHKLTKVDCIIALGSHDTRIAERAAELFLRGLAPLLVCSGGFGRLTAKEWTKPEAEIFADIAIKKGVPKHKIIIENKSTNTGENIDYSFELLKTKGVTPKKVILVHKPYMERRAYAAFKKRFPNIEVLMASPEIAFEDYPGEILSKEEMINIMVGDTQRVKLYPAKGFMISQEIPEEVWAAYEELVQRGFNTQLVHEI